MPKLLLVFILFALVGCIAPKTRTTDAGTDAPIADAIWWREDRTYFTGQTVCFEPSNSSLSAEAKAQVAKVASYMKANPAVALRIEGHGDGSGNNEQNLELGDRRAEALREELTWLGVNRERIDTLACGKKPQTDHGYVPGAPRKWRRAEFILLTRPE